jgi:polyhydroxybutyrate depolymerase
MPEGFPKLVRSTLILFAFPAWGCSSESNTGRLFGTPGALGTGGTVSTSAAGGTSSVGAGGVASGGLGRPGMGGTSSGGSSQAGAGGLVPGDGGIPPEGAPDSGGNGLGDSGTIGTGPGDWGPGDYPPDIHAQTYLDISGVKGQGTYTRQYKVHVPPGYDPSVPTPVVFCIHGLSQNAVMFCVTGAALNTKSDEAGFILVMPNGYQNSWNGGTCCGAASNEHLDDVALFRAIFEELKSHVNVDLRRVYATGLSNGAYMSYRLACEASDLFAAVAPGAGAIGKNDIGGGTNASSDFTTCEPAHHVSVLDIHGTSDGLVPYSLQAPSLAHISGKDGCRTTTTPAVAPKSGGDTTCVSYAGCPTGTEVTGCSIAGGGHCWFGSPDCGTGGGAIGAAFVGANSNTMVNNDAVWAFFSRSIK